MSLFGAQGDKAGDKKNHRGRAFGLFNPLFKRSDAPAPFLRKPAKKFKPTRAPWQTVYKPDWTHPYSAAPPRHTHRHSELEICSPWTTHMQESYKNPAIVPPKANAHDATNLFYAIGQQGDSACRPHRTDDAIPSLHKAKYIPSQSPAKFVVSNADPSLHKTKTESIQSPVQSVLHNSEQKASQFPSRDVFRQGNGGLTAAERAKVNDYVKHELGKQALNTKYMNAERHLKGREAPPGKPASTYMLDFQQRSKLEGSSPASRKVTPTPVGATRPPTVYPCSRYWKTETQANYVNHFASSSQVRVR